jgi:hypothetical protein
MEYVSLDDVSKIDIGVARLVPEAIAKRFCLVAIGEEDSVIIVAMSDPLNVVAIDTITLKLNRKVKSVVGSAKEINEAIEAIYHGSDVEEQKLRNIVECEIDREEIQPEMEADVTEANINGEAAALQPGGQKQGKRYPYRASGKVDDYPNAYRRSSSGYGAAGKKYAVCRCYEGKNSFKNEYCGAKVASGRSVQDQGSRPQH